MAPGQRNKFYYYNTWCYKVCQVTYIIQPRLAPMEHYVSATLLSTSNKRETCFLLFAAFSSWRIDTY
jgi:hypothetical protein